MKKILLSVVCLLVVGIKVAMAQTSVAMLHHNDTVTVYAASQLQTAIDKAVTGDTIYLSAGMFGGMTLDSKPIAIIGAGQTTSISGDVTIQGTVNSGQVSISCVNMMKDLKIHGTITGAKIERCTIDGNCDCYYDIESLSGIELLQSYIRGKIDFNPTKVHGFTVVGSKIGTVCHGGSSVASVTFYHCNIGDIDSPSGTNCYDSCIIYFISYDIFKNCLYNQYGSTPTTQGCYDASFALDDELECSLDAESMKKYLGTDGSVVGITGGEVPFTLVSPTLQVTEHNLEVDNVEKKLKVTLTLGNK